MDLRQVSPVIGATVTGLDLGSADDDDVRRIVGALLEHKVLYFPDQHLTREGQRAIAARIGPVLNEGTFGADNTDLHHSDAPDIVRIVHDAENGRGLDNVWHTDSMHWPAPPMGAMLRAIEVPPVGGDTVWANMNAAWEGLSGAMQRLLAPLKAVNEVGPTIDQFSPERSAAIRERYLPVEHPLVRTHPVTGLKGIYACSNFTTRIVGLSPAESDELLRYLFRQAAVPEYQCRIQWQPGAVAMWDNRITQHYPLYDYAPAARVMERVAWIGDEPR